MATTRIIAMHAKQGRTIAQCLTDRKDYAIDSGKTEDGKYISAYACDPHTADAEFLLSKRQYEQLTGRTQYSNVIAYTDRAHIHNYIMWNSTSLDCRKKFRDFLGSVRAVARLSDMICLEHRLSVVEHPQRRKIYNKWLGDRAKPSNREQLRLAIDDALRQKPESFEALLKLLEGEGGGYRQWASVFNLKQMAKTVLYLQEHDLADYEELASKVTDASGRCDALTAKIRAAEQRMVEINTLKTHIINYAHTREIFAAYKKSGYSKRFLAEHESEIQLHRAAKKAFNEAGLQKLPTVKSLQTEFAQLLKKERAGAAVRPSCP